MEQIFLSKFHISFDEFGPGCFISNGTFEENSPENVNGNQKVN